MLSYDSKVEYYITKFIPVKPLPMTVFNFLTCNALQLLHALYVIVHINLPISSALVSKVTQNASTGPWFFYHSPSSLHLKQSTHTQERTERDWFIHTIHGIYFKSIQKGPSLKSLMTISTMYVCMSFQYLGHRKQFVKYGKVLCPSLS